MNGGKRDTLRISSFWTLDNFKLFYLELLSNFENSLMSKERRNDDAIKGPIYFQIEWNFRANTKVNEEEKPNQIAISVYIDQM